MNKIISAIIALIGVLHLFPVLGAAGAGRLASLYGVEINDPSLLLLMQHRAILFGLLGVFLIFAAFKRHLLPYAFAAGFVSMDSFLILAWASPAYNEAIHNVVLADIAGGILLTIALVLYLFQLKAKSDEHSPRLGVAGTV